MHEGLLSRGDGAGGLDAVPNNRRQLDALGSGGAEHSGVIAHAGGVEDGQNPAGFQDPEHFLNHPIPDIGVTQIAQRQRAHHNVVMIVRVNQLGGNAGVDAHFVCDAFQLGVFLGLLRFIGLIEPGDAAGFEALGKANGHET